MRNYYTKKEGGIGPLRIALPREALVAWTLWILISLAGLGFVAVYGLSVPFGDEWSWIGRAAGAEPVTWAWLWSPHNEHRMVLPRLIYLGLGKLSGWNFRAGAYFNVVLLSGLAFSLMLTARRLRGRTRWYDVFFPLALVHWAQAENLIWGFQLNFVTAVVLEGLVLGAVVRCGEQLSWGRAAGISLCLVLLGLCGMYGLAFVPPVACWLAFAAVHQFRSGRPRERRRAWLTGALAVPPLALVVLGWGSGGELQFQGVCASLRTAVQFFCFGVGPVAKELWPVSGGIVLALGGTAAWRCLTVFRQRPAERVRASGLLAYLGSYTALALAIGVGRAYLGPRAGFEVRYMTLAVPLWLWLFFVCEAYATEAVKPHLLRTLCIVTGVLFGVNVLKGVSYSENLCGRLANFTRDVRRGMPVEDLALRYADRWGYGNREQFTRQLTWLKQLRDNRDRPAGPGSGKSIRRPEGLRLH
ncbi:MAG: hypothetical protein JXB10_05235 [Pirellulales bacterium]|nr:hypothetical protein [Pirellulales bacterium]